MKAKKIFAIGSLAAIALSSTTALALNQYTDYLTSGVWQHGTTKWNGGGTVYSYYYDWDHNWSYASVTNYYGYRDWDQQFHDEARASTDAVAWHIDHAYYNFWD